MKTLKFMLAAATAIGLASATQADQYNTTGFEKLTVGTNVTTGVKDNTTSSYFYYAGEHDEDNESVIAAGTPDIARPRGASAVDAGRDKILQVSTGTDPLMRTYESIAGGQPQTATITSDIYVDTLVQFTVTPYTDTVTPNAADKLMIYLKESVVTNEFGEITSASTNLVVIGGYMVEDGVFEPKEYKVTGVNVEPNTWHRLTVKVIANYGALDGYHHPAFLIYLDGVSDPCVLDDFAIAEDTQSDTGYVAPFDDDSLTLTELDEKNLVFSLKCDSQTAATLQGVGFAGEGKVDDIVFSTLDPFATVYDFTFAFDPQKVSAVTYTVGGSSYDQAGAYEVEAGTEVAITSITYADEWMGGEITLTNMTASAGVYTVDADDASLTINPAVFFPRTATADQDGTAAHPYEVADAAAIVALQKGLLGGKNITGKNFVQTGNIDMSGVTDFYGIGWFSSSTSFASVPSGVASNGKTDIVFDGTYDGAGYTISNVTIVKHSYAGLFNNVSGTVKNLTVQDIGLSGTCTEWGCAIVGNASAGSLLENLTAVTSSGFNWGNSANHNVAGIVVRPIGAATIRGCVNNANISSVSKRLGGIASFVGSGTTGTVFDSCTNNATLVSTDGTRGVGGILGCAEGGVKNSPTANDTIIRNCADFGSETAQGSNGHAGAIVGSNWNESYTYTDDGGNTFKASTDDCGYVKNAVFGRAYATASTISGTDYLTTVKQADLAAGNQYTLLANVAASETPVFTLQADGDFIAFLLGSYTFAGTVDGAEGLTVTDATESGVTTFTAAASAPSGESLEPGEQSSTTYESQQAAEAALANVTIAASDAVTNALDAAAQEAYLAKFEAKVVSAGEGQYKVEVALTAAATTALQAEVDADAAEVIEDLDTATFTLTTTPGFYYSIEYGTSLDNMTEGARTLATGSTLQLTRPTTGGATSGFYKVLVNVAPAAVTP